MPAWDQLSINKPHLAYLILGGFTSLFMLCSLFVKERLYIGEATVATLCGVIFGPHAANIFNPLTWGNTDQITLECSRVVLVVQCFAVGVELPKAYMERHWRSVLFLLLPVMTFGWLITSLFMWWLIVPLTWLEALICAACVTATDPVLASSVVGKGKFSKRVPRHLRDLLSAESGCNDGMAFPFIYLSFYLIHYKLDGHAVTFHWFCNTVLYECVFGLIYGVLIGYGGRHAIKWADRHDLVDRESFLVFYFVLALFCAGTGATLGTDDLLVGFAAGVGFSNDGWFTQKTEESHVSNVIDLLLNLAYFVYLGSIIPWEQYNNPLIGLTPWRLVVIALLVLFFRRIPIMLALKPVIPDIKTWREALFAGHFGPIGVGAIFAAILARAELETDSTEPLAVVPTDPESENYNVVQIIWPLTTFLVITSILVHGSSVAVFTLGKHINNFTLTMSYTQANEEGPSWMNRLPRMANSARQSMSKSKDDFSASSSIEKSDYPPGELPPVGLPGNFLRRQKEEDTPIERPQAARRRSRWDSGMGPGGHVEESAIRPQRRNEKLEGEDSVSDTLGEKSTSPSGSDEKEEPDQLDMEDAQEKRDAEERKKPHRVNKPEIEAYEEDDKLVVEDEEGNVIAVHDIQGKSEEQKAQFVEEDERKLREDKTGYFAKDKSHPHEAEDEGSEIEDELEQDFGHPSKAWKKLTKRFMSRSGSDDADKKRDDKPAPTSSKGKANQVKDEISKSGQAAYAYQFGQTLIVEDEDGEVIRKIDLGPKSSKGNGAGDGSTTHIDTTHMRQGLKRMTTWAGLHHHSKPEDRPVEQTEDNVPEAQRKHGKKQAKEDADDDRLRFTVGSGGRRMSKQEFVKQLQQMDPKARRRAVEESDAPKEVKDEVHADAINESKGGQSAFRPGPARKESKAPMSSVAEQGGATSEDEADGAYIRRMDTNQETAPQSGSADHTAQDQSTIPEGAPSEASDEIPAYNVRHTVQRHTAHRPNETAAQRRRRLALNRQDSEDDGTDRVLPSSGAGQSSSTDQGETAAERRRRLAALGVNNGADSDSEDDGTGERRPPRHKKAASRQDTGLSSESETVDSTRRGIRFAEGATTPTTSTGGRISWGQSVGRGKK